MKDVDFMKIYVSHSSNCYYVNEIYEPLKCSELCYFSINELPFDVISFEKEALIDNLNGIKFGVIDIDEEKDMNRFC